MLQAITKFFAAQKEAEKNASEAHAICCRIDILNQHLAAEKESLLDYVFAYGDSPKNANALANLTQPVKDEINRLSAEIASLDARLTELAA